MSEALIIANPVGPRGNRNALLVFADPVALDLQRRGWSQAAAPLFQLSEAQLSSGDGSKWDVHFFSSGPVPGHLPADWQAHRQRGRAFGERIENALHDLCASEYERVVVVGRDCPDLTAGEISTAFDHLEADSSVVLGPDQKGGCYLIGIHAADVGCLHDIRWRQNTDLAEIASRFAPVLTFVLPAKIDLDSAADLALFAANATHRLVKLALRFLVGWQLTRVARRWEVRFDLARHLQRIGWQLPPPKELEQIA